MRGPSRAPRRGAAPGERGAGRLPPVREGQDRLTAVDAIVARASERLAAGETLEALHLAEVALGGAPSHHGASLVLVDAHRTLLATPENFWERAWLQREVERYQSRSHG